jgi:hypothetical protein
MARRNQEVAELLENIARLLTMQGDSDVYRIRAYMNAARGVDLEPRDVEELIGFYFGPEGTPLATPTAATVQSEAELPQGEPVDPAVEEAVNATVAELFACFDAGQYARGFALMTDDLARQFGPDVNNPDEDTPEEVRALLEAQLAGTPVVDEPDMEQGASTDVGRGRDLRTLELSVSRGDRSIQHRDAAARFAQVLAERSARIIDRLVASKNCISGGDGDCNRIVWCVAVRGQTLKELVFVRAQAHTLRCKLRALVADCCYGGIF